jgi:hypothetical protein
LATAHEGAAAKAVADQSARSTARSTSSDSDATKVSSHISGQKGGHFFPAWLQQQGVFADQQPSFFSRLLLLLLSSLFSNQAIRSVE